MAELTDEVAKAAQRAVKMAKDRGGAILDFSEESLTGVEEILAEVAEYSGALTESQLSQLSEDFGSYILEVARRRHGGTYHWHSNGEPVLVVGEPNFHVAIVTWGKVHGRMSGDESNNIPFFYQGFSDRVQGAKPGLHCLYV